MSMTKFWNWVTKFLDGVHKHSTPIVLLTMIGLVVFCIGWLCFVTSQMKPDGKPIEVKYTYAIQKDGQTYAVPKVKATPAMDADEIRFKNYKEVEEILSGQMNSWLTILTLLGVMLGLIVPLAGYLLQRRTLEEEKKQFLEQFNEVKKHVENVKADAEEAAKAMVEQKLEEMKTSVIDLANKTIEEVRKSLEDKLEKKEETLKSQISEIQKSLSPEKKVTPTKFDETLKKAENGNVQAQFDVGVMYYFGNGCVTNYREAYKWIRKAAEQKNVPAQFHLGYMLANEQGCEKDEKEAVAWYRKAAELGNASAQNNLGVMLANGRGCEKDEEEAVTWYRKAAEQGNANAQNSLGWRLAEGRGCEKDEKDAVAWYRKAAEQGHAMAQNNLGNMLADGRGCEANGEEALRWLHESEKQGNAYAQENLGEVFEYGKAGIKKGPDKAEMWYRKALANPSAVDAVKKAATEGLERIKKARGDGGASQGQA